MESNGHRRFRTRIDGMHCSLCTGTIEEALGDQNGVDDVAVSLTHEQALVEYDPERVGPDVLVQTLRDVGYSISDPRKTRPFEEQEATLAAEGRRFFVAIALSLATVALIAEPLKDDAPEAIERLRDAGLHVHLLTGDAERTARAVAEELGIETVHAEVLPDEKAEYLRTLAMVGDGINDAPALTQADVGIALGTGTDIAIESADVIVMTDRLPATVDAYGISRWGYRKMTQNVVLAFLFNGVGIPLAATGLIYPVWAMVAMAASVTSIFLNSLWGRGELFTEAIRSVGRPLHVTSAFS